MMAMSEAAARFEAIRQVSAKRPHGTRARYVGARCRCTLCRAANSRYQCQRDAAKRLEGDDRSLVSIDAARAHIRKLAKLGVGYKVISEATGISSAIVFKVRNGKRAHIRRSTERLILAVDRTCIADGSRVPAARTWKLLNELIELGWRRCQLAVLLGSNSKTPALQVARDFVSARTASKVERLYIRIQEGRVQRK